MTYWTSLKLILHRVHKTQGIFIRTIIMNSRNLSEYIIKLFLCLQCALDTRYWTGFNHFFIWGSIIFYFLLVIIVYIPKIGYTYQGVMFMVLKSWNFWFSMLLTNVILLVPVIAYRFHESSINPTLSDKIRLKQRIEKNVLSEKHMGVYRTPSSRHSHISVRSGYAFSHEQGFGDLITSGKIMRQCMEPRNWRSCWHKNPRCAIVDTWQ